MPRSLPVRPSLEWLKKTAKDELKLLRAQNPEAVLADAQRHAARDYGFDSWRKLKRHVEQKAADATSGDAEGAVAGDSRDEAMKKFLHLVGTGQIDEVRRILAAAPQEALLFGDDRLVEQLLRPGAPALPKYAPNGGSILNFARTICAIDRLLDLGVAADIADRWGATPIESMSRLGSRGRPLVQHLIERGVAAAPEEYARMGDAERLRTLFERDPGVIKSDAVMMAAVDFRHHALVEWLLAKGGNVNARTSARSRHTALHSAAWNGDLPMAMLLVDAGADLAARDEEHHGTPLGWAEVSLDITNNPQCKEVAIYLEQLSPVR